MGRNNSDFQSGVPLYRGVGSTNPITVNPNGAGIHWTTAPEVAHDFARQTVPDFGNEDGDYYGSSNPPIKHGLVMEGIVHPKHLLDPSNPEHKKVLEDREVKTPGDANNDDTEERQAQWERERTVQPGAPIRITKHHYLVQGKVIRSEDVNYEGKA